MVPRVAPACGGTTSRWARSLRLLPDRHRLRAAPWYAENVAGTGPNNTHLTDTITVDGEQVDVISAGGTGPGSGDRRARDQAVTVLGPQLWHADGKYVLGADTLGRDIAVRVLYGGRNSL